MYDPATIEKIAWQSVKEKMKWLLVYLVPIVPIATAAILGSIAITWWSLSLLFIPTILLSVGLYLSMENRSVLPRGMKRKIGAATILLPLVFSGVGVYLLYTHQSFLAQHSILSFLPLVVSVLSLLIGIGAMHYYYHKNMSSQVLSRLKLIGDLRSSLKEGLRVFRQRKRSKKRRIFAPYTTFKSDVFEEADEDKGEVKQAAKATAYNGLKVKANLKGLVGYLAEPCPFNTDREAETWYAQYNMVSKAFIQSVDNEGLEVWLKEVILKASDNEFISQFFCLDFSDAQRGLIIKVLEDMDDAAAVGFLTRLTKKAQDFLDTNFAPKNVSAVQFAGAKHNSGTVPSGQHKYSATKRADNELNTNFAAEEPRTERTYNDAEVSAAPKIRHN